MVANVFRIGVVVHKLERFYEKIQNYYVNLLSNVCMCHAQGHFIALTLGT